VSLRPRQVPRVRNQHGLAVGVTEVQRGAVDTAMLKPESQLSRDVRRALVASPTKSANQPSEPFGTGRSTPLPISPKCPIGTSLTVSGRA